MSNLRRLSSAARLKEVVVPAKVDCFAVVYRGAPLSSLFVPGNPHHSAGVALTSRGVAHVFALAHISQVFPAIIQGVPVDVVNALLRPVTRHIQKGEAMKRVDAPLYHHSVISPLEASCDGTAPRALSCQPSKNPSIRTVMQDGFKVRLSQFHEALHKLIGIVTGGCRPQVTHYSTEIY